MAENTPPKALLFDVFGTLADWRSGIAREAERVLGTHKKIDWIAFADAWRGEYQPGMEEVRTGRQSFAKLDVLHRRNLDRILPRFNLTDVPDATLSELNLAWHKLPAWPDVTAALRSAQSITPVVTPAMELRGFSARDILDNGGSDGTRTRDLRRDRPAL